MFGIPIILLPNEKVCELEENMSASYFALKIAAQERYGTNSVKRLRDEYKQQQKDYPKNNLLWSNPLQRSRMEWMIANEQVIFSAFIGVSVELCKAINSFSSQRPGITIADYAQEAMMATYDAMYMYNGNDRFSTYVYSCVKNRLISFLRHEDRISGVSREIQSLRLAVKGIMNNKHCDVETALSILKREKSVSDATIDSVRDAMFEVASYSGEKVISPKHIGAFTAKIEAKPDDETEMMRRAIAETDLTVMERRLLEAHIAGDKNFRTRISETEINQNTGTYWTKQRLSQIFGMACDKVRERYETQRPLSEERKAA